MYSSTDRPGQWLGLDGARVLIAGAGGIGLACATAFADVGARIAIFDANPEKLRAASSSLTSACYLREVDLAVPEQVKTAVDAVEDEFGGLDVVLHAVGINIRKPSLQLEPDEWLKVLKVNLDSAFWLAQAAGRHMVPRQSGRIILVSSVSSQLAHPDHAPYAATKAGLNQMMRVMAREWANDGVTLNAIAPGYIETELTIGYLEKEENRQKLTSLVPMGRLGVPQELTGPVLFLASPHSSFITGQVLFIDGGRTLV